MSPCDLHPPGSSGAARAAAAGPEPIAVVRVPGQPAGPVGRRLSQVRAAASAAGGIVVVGAADGAVDQPRIASEVSAAPAASAGTVPAIHLAGHAVRVAAPSPQSTVERGAFAAAPA